MDDDWPNEGVAAAAELAAVWRDTFISHRRKGDDDAWAAHFADLAVKRFMSRVQREAKRSERTEQPEWFTR